MKLTGQPRTINRQKLLAEDVEAALDLKEPRLQPLQVCRDILSEKDYQPGARRLLTLELGPYQASRLKAGGLLP